MRYLALLAITLACHADVRDPGLTARGVARRTREAAAHAKAAAGVAGVTVLPQSGHAGKVEAVALSADGNLLATGGEDGATLVWDLRSGKLLRRFSDGHAVQALAFAGGENQALWVGADGQVVEHLFHSEHLGWREPLPGLGGRPRMLASTPDDVHAIFAIAEGAMVIDKTTLSAFPLSLEDGPIAMERMGDVQVYAAALDATGAHALTATNRAVVLWDVAKRAPVALSCDDMLGGTSDYRFVGFWNQLAYAVRDSGSVEVWDVGTQQCVGAAEADNTWVYAIGLDAATGTLHGLVERDVSEHVVARRAWSVKLGKGDLEIRHGERTVVSEEHSPEVAIASTTARAAVVENGVAHVIDLDSGGTLLDVAVARQVTADLPRAVALAPDGATAIVALDDRVIRLDLATMQRQTIAELRHPSGLAWCEDGRHLAIVHGSTVSVEGVAVIDDIDHPKLRELFADNARRPATAAVAFGPQCSDVVVAEGFLGRLTTEEPSFVVQRFGPDGSAGPAQALPLRTFWGGSAGSWAQRYGAQGWFVIQIGPASWQIVRQAEIVGVIAADLSRPGASGTTDDGAWRLERVSEERMRLLDASGEEVTYGLSGIAQVRSVAVAADGHTVTVGQLGGWTDRWDLATGTPIDAQRATASVLAASRDGTLAIAEGDAGLVVAATGDLEHPRVALRGHRSKVVSAAVAARAPRALTAAEDGTLRLWDTNTGDSLALAMVGDQWIQYTNEGYFSASPDGAELVSVVAGDHAYNIDQLAAQYDRPDVLLERFGLATAPIRDALSARVAVVMARAGITTASSALDIPQVELVSTAREGDTLVATVDVRAANSALARLRVDVNGVPIESRAVSGQRATERIRVPLAIGDNRVEISAIDAAGLESYRALVAAHRDGTPSRALYYVGFGVSKYARADLRLGFAAKDANDLAAQLLRYRGHGYRDVHVTTFEDAEVDRGALAEARRFLAAAGPEDDVVIFVAGHGMLDDATGVYYYLPHGADPDDLAHTAITFSDLEGLTASTASRRRLVLMDTCDSGEWDPTDLALATSAAAHAGLVARTQNRGAHARPASPRLPGAYRESMLFRDLFRRSGAIVISSSRGDELSYEDPKLGNGLFTHAVLRALTTNEADRDGDGSVSVAELRAYVAASVGKASGDRQHPTIDRDNRFLQLAFPIVR